MEFKSKKQALQTWAILYFWATFIIVVLMQIGVKFGVWINLAIIFTWLNILSLNGDRIKQKYMIQFIDDKASASINLLTESIKLQSQDLRAIHNWIKTVTYPRTSPKLH
jgi:hypothetical protein